MRGQYEAGRRRQGRELREACKAEQKNRKDTQQLKHEQKRRNPKTKQRQKDLSKLRRAHETSK